MSDAPEGDFPAAHSMDSAWFAVDADGHVASFDTGENGAVPYGAAPGGGNLEIDFDALLLDALLAGIALRDELAKPPEKAEAEEEDDDPAPVPPLPGHDQPQRVVILSAAPSFAEGDAGYRQAPKPRTRAEATFREGELVVVKEADPRILVSLDPVIPERVAALREFSDATVLVVSDLYYVVREGGAGATPEGGIFEYRHDLYNDTAKGSGTYTRQVAPRSPVTLDDVHPSIRDDLAGLRLPVHFAGAPVVELADHMGENDVQTYGTPLDPANAPPPPPRAPLALPPGAGALVAVAVVVVVLVVLALVKGRG